MHRPGVSRIRFLVLTRIHSTGRAMHRLAAGSEAEAKKRGLLRTEDKSYVVQDGDVLHILFNV